MRIFARGFSTNVARAALLVTLGTFTVCVTADAADMLRIADRVGRLQAGLDADVLLLDGDPLSISTSVLRAWVSGVEVR